MLWVPQKGRVLTEHNLGSVGAATHGTSITTGGSASTKGTPAEVFAATAFDAYWVTILASNYGSAGVASQGAIDVLTGASTEEVLIPNLLMGYCGGFLATAGNGPKRWDFPLYVPAGSRIAVQAAGARTGVAMNVGIILHGGNGYPPFRVGSKVTTYGMGTVPAGTTITPGASGAEGSWTQITAGTSEDHFAFVPSFQATGDVTTSTLHLMVDVGIGAATEEMIAESYWFATDTNERMAGPFNTMPAFQDVPSGTRLVMRASNSGANDGGYNGAIHALS